MLPTSTTSYEVIVDLLNLLRGEVASRRLNDKLIVMFGIEPYIHTIIENALSQSFIVVMNNSMCSGFNVLEYYNPIVSEYLTVIDDQSHFPTSSTK